MFPPTLSSSFYHVSWSFAYFFPSFQSFSLTCVSSPLCFQNILISLCRHQTIYFPFYFFLFYFFQSRYVFSLPLFINLCLFFFSSFHRPSFSTFWICLLHCISLPHSCFVSIFLSIKLPFWNCASYRVLHSTNFLSHSLCVHPFTSSPIIHPFSPSHSTLSLSLSLSFVSFLSCPILFLCWFYLSTLRLPFLLFLLLLFIPRFPFPKHFALLSLPRFSQSLLSLSPNPTSLLPFPFLYTPSP